MKKVANIVFYKFFSEKEDIQVREQACIFYDDGTVASVSVDEAIEAAHQIAVEEKIKTKEEFKESVNKARIHVMSGEDFERRFQEFVVKAPEKAKVKELTPADYHMTQEAWDDYIAEGFVPGTPDFDGAVILDGTGKVPSKENTPAPTALVPVNQPTGLVPVNKPTALVPVGPQKTLTPVKPREVTPEPSKPKVTIPVITPPVPRLPEPTPVPRLTGPTVLINPTVPTKTPTVPTKTPTVPTKTPTVPTKTPTVPVVVPTPKPTPTLTPKEPTPTMTPAPKKPQVGLMQTIEKITKGVEVSRKDGKAYQASNIKIAQNFKNELHSGNYLYNIVHLVPAIVKLPFQFLAKISGKLRFTKDSKQRIKIMKERIENLSEEELMVIYDEYRGNRVMQERLPSAINILLQEKMEQFIMGKVTALNAQLEADYADIFNAMMELEAVDHGLKNGDFSKEDKEYLTNYRKQLLQGRAEQVKRIRENYKEAQRLLSGGLNGYYILRKNL